MSREPHMHKLSGNKKEKIIYSTRISRQRGTEFFYEFK